jgi:hypothetical protein
MFASEATKTFLKRFRKFCHYFVQFLYHRNYAKVPVLISKSFMLNIFEKLGKRKYSFHTLPVLESIEVPSKQHSVLCVLYCG